ncbi:hypothetical protein B9G98_02743 [Wickerhamiella sorbophila]|uniref:FAR-17a/AIG1-like protein n=1 Tax=Wickerhamiella sorbophila TaxID=45607 RepID=A0A2T0FJD9_9ASCO|nr:hypothetical protein B9G98_02743 [Wickerhamiella sorbophila]PRT55123.1 hypothetical protein B9G98_02743 [Wickerhamiella sorbophila]
MLLRYGLNCLALWTYYTGLHALLVRDDSLIARSYSGHLQFLTILGLCLSFIGEAVSLVAQLSQLRSFRRLSSWLLQVCAPIECLISALYWALRFVDTDLVLDPKFALELNPSLDRKLHLYPALFEVLRAVMAPPDLWHAGFVGPFAVFGALAGGYWAWIDHVFSHNNFYPYPLFEVLNFEQRVGLFAFSAFVLVVIYKLIQRAQYSVH